MRGNDETGDESCHREREDPLPDGEGLSLPGLDVHSLFYLDGNLGGRMLTINIEHKELEDATWATLPQSGA